MCAAPLALTEAPPNRRLERLWSVGGGQRAFSDPRQQSSAERRLGVVDPLRYSSVELGVAGEGRSLKEDAGFVSQERVFAGCDDQTVERTPAVCKVVGGEVGYDDIAVGVFLREDEPEMASSIETEESVAWVHEAWA